MTGNNKSFGEVLGRLVAKVIIACLAIIIASTVVAVSVKIVQGILTWLF